MERLLQERVEAREKQRQEAQKQRQEAAAKAREARKAKQATSPPPRPRKPPTRLLAAPGVENILSPEVVAEPYEPPVYKFDEATADPEAELARRELCRRHLLPFVQRFRPRYMAGWVHADICTRIEQFVADVEALKSPRLLLCLPPRSGKSELSSRHAPAWILGRHPEWEIIAAGHSASLALSFSRYIRDLLRNPGYNTVFPGTVLDPLSQSVENWNIVNGGGYLAAGQGTGITGRGAHVLILDDLVRDKEAASSPTIRDNTWEWYISTAYTRLAPGGGVLGLMTWWNEDDWAGRIQRVSESGEGDRFEVVKYPALNDKGDESLCQDGRIVYSLPPAPPPPGAKLTRRQGTAIHPERYDTSMMCRIRDNLISSGQKWVWDSLYQQNPIPDEGNHFRREYFHSYGEAPSREQLRVYQAWDFAITEKTQSDYTVGVTVGQDQWDNLYLLDLSRFREDDGGVLVEEVLDFAAKWNPDVLGFEDGQIWKTLDFQFKKRCAERRQYPSFELLKPLTDKITRASPLKGRMQLGKVFFPQRAPWLDELMREMLHFPDGTHDDQVDALAWAVRLTLSRSAPRQEHRGPKLTSWREKLMQEALRVGGTSHMAA
jgi:predicted phage terminase large subunit-like protein